MEEYLREYPSNAIYVAERCPEHRLLALSVDGRALNRIPKREQTVEQVEAAVRQSPYALAYASKLILKHNPWLYRVAVKSDGMALKAVPDEYRYEGIFEDAVSSNADALELVPEEELTNDLFMTAVRSSGLALAHIPKEQITREMVLEAFASDVRAVKYIPGEYCDRAMALAAVSADGTLLGYVPSRLVDREIAETAVENDGNALQYVPNHLKTAEMCDAAIVDAPLSILYVPPRFSNDGIVCKALGGDWRAIRYLSNPSDKFLLMAFEQSPLALEYFPSGKKTSEICEIACARDPRAIRFVPRKLVSASMLRNWLSSFFGDDGEKLGSPALDDMKALRSVDQDQLRDPAVAALMRKLGVRETKSARWVEKSSSFLVTEVVTCGWDYRFFGPSPYSDCERHLLTFSITTRVGDLDSLSELLGGELGMVEFKGYSFEDYDPARHNLSEAKAPVRTLKRLDAYDDSAYQELVGESSSLLAIVPSEAGEAFPAVPHSEIVLAEGVDPGKPLYYVSDLHLNHKLSRRFPTEATEIEIREYLDDIAREMSSTAPEGDREDSTLLILGDTSFNFEVGKLFFSSLRRHWGGQIVVILGNHELWDYSRAGKGSRPTPTISDVAERYWAMLEENSIKLLQNELLIRYRGMRDEVLDYETFCKMPDEELARYLARSSQIIIGGIGFTGLSKDFNAENGIYRDVITTLEEDAALSREFSSLHERVRRLAPKGNVIVATHMPMRDWSEKGYQPGWVYVSGHTHRNTFIEDGSIRAYEDNQSGYGGSKACLRRFYVEPDYNPFRDFEDGIHEIERMDYLDFNRMRGIDITSFTRKGRILMLKREGVYLFLFEWEETGDLYLLSGGGINSLAIQNPEYYYENMVAYSSIVRAAFSGYQSAIRLVSDGIRKIGGEGTVHGCIVDIDYYNHVYLDPHTGKLTFYFAESIDDRTEFQDLEGLLWTYRPELLPGLRALNGECEADGAEESILLRGAESSIATSVWTDDTSMYKPSRVMLSIQRLFDASVIRVWNEDVIRSYKQGNETRGFLAEQSEDETATDLRS